MFKTYSGIIFPYATKTAISGLCSVNHLTKSGRRSDFGVITSRPLLRTKLSTAEGVGLALRPTGSGGCVTTASGGIPDSNRARSDDTARSGVPKKMILGVLSLETFACDGELFLCTRAWLFF